MMPPEGLVIAIGEARMRAARATGEPWDDAGWMFETRDGRSSSGTDFQFAGRRQLSLAFTFDDQDLILDSFKARARRPTSPGTRIGSSAWPRCARTAR